MHTILTILHILGAGIILGSVFFSVLILLRDLSKEILGTLKIIRSSSTYAIILQVVTGLILVFQEPEEFKASALFWTKMGLFVIDGIIAIYLVDRKIQVLEKGYGQSIPRGLLPIWATINLLLITTIIILGVLI